MSLPTGDFIEAVRTSCKNVVEKSPVNISMTGVDDFLNKLEKPYYEELSIDTPMRMPVKFSTLAEEINFVCVIDLLNFGSGYRVPLHELTGRGAFDTIRFGVMSFHIGGTPMDAKTFKDITLWEVASTFQIPVTQEVDHETLQFVKTVVQTPLKPFAEGIQQVLNSTGEFLVDHGYKDLAAFVLDLTRPEANKEPRASQLVEQLVRALPGLQDLYTTPDGDTVYLFKKAQIMVYHLWMFFHDQEPARFNFVDIHNLTVFSDNVLPTMLIHLGVLTMPEDWQNDLDTNTDVGPFKGTVLRAAAVTACDVIVEHAASVGPVPHMHTGDLDVYLWRLGKVGDYRKVPRMEWRDTVMF
ncbi:hypothetical protein DM01DRAFT_1328524 [Hesseltinella vesiculosa]|uniref:Queuosine 5'-phosphate N-glycosylase/hydrolase n=1 Tax=Hesseltinella vesiculosa TaxID=101127 RepID=A0A1X2G511_9FUNG|nr:hypothetical protein DM01DRAFT_1328524 [Hesseltinella vesiculosa]